MLSGVNWAMRPFYVDTVFGLLITASYLVSHFRFPASQYSNQFFLSLTVQLFFSSVMFFIYLFIQCSFTGFTWAGRNSLSHPFNRSPFSAEAPYSLSVSMTQGQPAMRKTVSWELTRPHQRHGQCPLQLPPQPYEGAVIQLEGWRAWGTVLKPHS